MRLLRYAAAVSLLALACGTAQAQIACESLKGLQLPDVQITDAVPAKTPAPHCKLSGVIGKEIKFSVWLPDAWNGKFVMGGQGGFAGRVDNQALSYGALLQGYASAGTDTGHAMMNGADGSWALGEMERIVNYAHLGIHRTTEVSKAAVNARYGRQPEKSYFAGCSNGGRQALMAAQRYPDDFDGIIAGAPALNLTWIANSFANVTQKMYPDPKNLSTPMLNKADRDALGKAMLAQCDAKDGLTDGIVSDPQVCTFDPKVIACKGGNKDGCLSKPELAAAETIYRGPGKGYGVGFPVGGEAEPAGWLPWLVGGKDMAGKGMPSLAFGFSTGLLGYMIAQDKDWSYANYDPSKPHPSAGFFHSTLSPTDPDLSAFRKSGGKLLMFHGWADSALSANMSLDYHGKVLETDASASNDVRLFMLPGVLHCSGGPGPDQVDYLTALDQWVGGGKAPDELKAGFSKGGGDRKVCAWPKKAVFTGQGDGRSASQFECR